MPYPVSLQYKSSAAEFRSIVFDCPYEASVRALETSGSHVFVAGPIEMVRIGLGAKAVFSYCGERKLWEMKL